jgi:hypothetical protein
MNYPTSPGLSLQSCFGGCAHRHCHARSLTARVLCRSDLSLDPARHDPVPWSRRATVGDLHLEVAVSIIGLAHIARDEIEQAEGCPRRARATSTRLRARPPASIPRAAWPADEAVRMLVGALADRTVVNLDASDLEDARTLLDRLDTTNPSAGQDRLALAQPRSRSSHQLRGVKTRPPAVNLDPRRSPVITRSTDENSLSLDRRRNL